MAIYINDGLYYGPQKRIFFLNDRSPPPRDLPKSGDCTPAAIALPLQQ
jgi:hypothetical protein